MESIIRSYEFSSDTKIPPTCFAMHGDKVTTANLLLFLKPASLFVMGILSDQSILTQSLNQLPLQ